MEAKHHKIINGKQYKFDFFYNPHSWQARSQDLEKGGAILKE